MWKFPVTSCRLYRVHLHIIWGTYVCRLVLISITAVSKNNSSRIGQMVFVYRAISMDLIWFCNYVFLPWLLYVILCWSLSVLSCWDSFWLLCIKRLNSKDKRVSNILRMLVVWWATSRTNLIVKYVSHVHKCPILLNLSRPLYHPQASR